MVTSEEVQKYNEEGFLVIPNFLTLEEVELLRSECSRIVQNMNPSDTSIIHVGTYEV